jgi:hypothetical protein
MRKGFRSSEEKKGPIKSVKDSSRSATSKSDSLDETRLKKAQTDRKENRNSNHTLKQRFTSQEDLFSKVGERGI